MIANRLLADPAEAGLEDEHLERVSTIADQLWHKVSSDTIVSDLIARREACRAAREYAADAARYSVGPRLLVPLLVEVLQEENRRQLRSSADAMILSGPSRSVQATAAAAVAETIDLVFLRIYEQLGEPIEPVIDTLVQTFFEGRVNEARGASLRALFEVSLVFPEIVADHLAEVEDADATLGNLIANTDSEDTRRYGARLLAVFAVHCPGVVAFSTPVEEGIEKARQEGNNETRAYAATAVIATRMGSGRPASEALLRDRTIQSVIDNFQNGQLFPRKSASLALGEAIALWPVTPSVPHSLIEKARAQPAGEEYCPLQPSTTEERFSEVGRSIKQDRELAIRALGEIAAFSTKESASVPEALRAEADPTTGDTEPGVARVLGEVAAATTFFDDATPKELVDRVEETSGRDHRDAAQLLGEVVAVTSSYSKDALASLVDRVAEGPAHQRSDAVQVLGEVVAAVSPDGLNPPEALLEQIQSVPDWATRKGAVGALGEVVVSSDQSTDPVRALIERIYRTTGVERDAAIQALGELVVAELDSGVTGHTGLLNRVEEASESDERETAIRVLGEAIAILPNGEEPIPEALIDQARDSTEWERRATVRTLGELGVTDPDTVPNTPPALVHRIHEVSDQSPQAAVRALGEVVAATPEGVPRAVETLVDCVENATDWEPRHAAARALGELVLTVPKKVPDPPRALCCRFRNLDELKAASWILGEGLAIDRGDSEAVLRGLVDRVHETTKAERRTAIHVLGAAVAASDEAVPAPPPLVARVRETAAEDPAAFVNAFGPGDTEQSAVRALGEVVASANEPFESGLEALISRVHDGVGSGSSGMNSPSRTTYSRSANDHPRAAIRALGVIAEVDSEAIPKIPAELIERIQTTSGPERQAAIRTMGEIVAADPKSADLEDVRQSLLNRIDDTVGKKRHRTLEALGELLAGGILTAQTVPQPLLDRVHDTTGADRDWAARLVGEVHLNGPSDGIELVARKVRKLVSQESRRPLPGLLIYIAASGSVDTETFLQSISADSSSNSEYPVDVRPYLDLDEPERRQSIRAIAVALSNVQTASFPSLSRQLYEFLTANKELPPATRLVTVNVLSTLAGTDKSSAIL